MPEKKEVLNMARKRYEEKVNGSIRRRKRTRKDGSTHILYEFRYCLGKDEYGVERRKSESFKSEKEAIERRRDVDYILSQAKKEHWSDAKLMDVLYPTKYRKHNSEITHPEAMPEVADITEIPADSAENIVYTVDAWFEKWITTYVRGAESTKKKYRGDYYRYISPKIGNEAISKIISMDIQAMVNDWQDPEKAIKKPLSNKYVSDMHAMLKSCFKQAVENKLIDSNPCNGTTFEEEIFDETEDNIHITWEQLLELMSVLRSSPHARFYLFSAFFGLRVMENLGLTMNDIDMEKKVIHLRYQLRRNFNEKPRRFKNFTETKHFKIVKDKETRDIYFDDVVAAILREQIAYEKLKKQRLGDKWPKKELERGDLLFSNDNGYYLSYSTIRDCFYRRARKIVPNIRIHDLRHIYVSIAFESNIPMDVTARHLGHSDEHLTRKIYLSIPDEKHRKSAATVGKTIADILNGVNPYNDKSV